MAMASRKRHANEVGWDDIETLIEDPVTHLENEILTVVEETLEDKTIVTNEHRFQMIVSRIEACLSNFKSGVNESIGQLLDNVYDEEEEDEEYYEDEDSDQTESASIKE